MFWRLSSKLSCIFRPSLTIFARLHASSASSMVSGKPPSTVLSLLFLSQPKITSYFCVLCDHSLLAWTLPQTHIYVPMQQLWLAFFGLFAQFFPLQKAVLCHPTLIIHFICIGLTVVKGSVWHDFGNLMTNNIFILFCASAFWFEHLYLFLEFLSCG